MKEFIYLDGRLFKHGFPLRSLFYGEGVFETFRCNKTLPVFWKEHMGRMKTGAEALEIPFPGIECIENAVNKAVARSGIADVYVKVCLLSRGDSVFYERAVGSSLLILVKEYQSFDKPVSLQVSHHRRSSFSHIAGFKTLNYLENVLARRDARKPGFDEAMLLNERGEVAEGSASNIFWLQDGVLYTPSVECGILPGVIRRAVIEVSGEIGIRVNEGRYDLNSLVSSQAVFLTNSLLGAVAVQQIQGIRFQPEIGLFRAIKNALFGRLKWL